MKKNDVLLIASVALYSYLFYAQSAGINFLLFTVGLLALQIIKDRYLLVNKAWIVAAIGSIASAVAVVLYGNGLTVTANIISLSLAASFSLYQSSSLILALLYSIYSYLSSIAFMIIALFEKKAKEITSKNSATTKFLLILIPVVITLIFFLMYREANPIFKNFTKNINLDFITFAWVRFTLLGFILLYGFFNHRNILYLFNKDLRASDNLNNGDSSDHSLVLGKSISKENENLSGIILFALLNLLLLLVNTLDINFLWGSGALPDGMTYSEFVHQGVGLLIASILIAIAIILFYFRGGLNFYKKNTAIKLLAYLWIVQNAILIITTLSKNQLYVAEYSLTYKRIGVFVYLTLSLIGLATTFIKIVQLKSNWFLFRKNGWAFYYVLLIACFINWDLLITTYNINHSKELDKEYLLTLSGTPLPELIAYIPNGSAKSDDGVETNYKRNLHYKIYTFLNDWKISEWKSWNSEVSTTHKRIMLQENTGKLSAMDLSGRTISNLAPLEDCKQLKELNLSGNAFRNVGELSYFPQLKKLNISSNEIDSIHKFPELKNLTELYISNNRIKDITYLSLAPSLEVLDVSNNQIYTIYQFPDLPKLTSLDLSSSRVKNYHIGHYKQLKDLKLNSINKSQLGTLPELASLESLELRKNSINSLDNTIFGKIASCKNLKKLDLSSNVLSTINLIPFEGNVIQDLALSNNELKNIWGIEKFTHLTTLTMVYCGLSDITPVSSLSELTELQLTGNRITNLSPLSAMTNLKKLDLTANRINDIKPLESLVNLEDLDLDGNDITDIKSLAHLTKLKKLILNSNVITDYSSLQKLSNLESLELSNISDDMIKIIYSLKKLRYLKCDSMSNQQMKELQKAFPHLTIDSQYTDVNDYALPAQADVSSNSSY